MNIYIKKIKNNPLFQNLTEQDFNILLEPDSCIVGRYEKKTVIMHEGELCRSIGFILDGALSVQQLSPSGELINIQIFHQGDCFGPALLYAKMPCYPYTLVTSVPTNVLYIPFSQIETLLKTSMTFNKNYIAFLSNRISIFQKKIRILSEKEVRSRLILYFSYEFSKAKETSFLLNHTKTEIADMIGVARPSVSRELKHMQEDGLIIMERNLITIKEPNIFTLKYNISGMPEVTHPACPIRMWY